MDEKNQSHIEAFRAFAEESLEKSTSFQQMVGYAHSLTEKVKELLATTTFDTKKERDDLQKELFQLGSEFIRKFSSKYRNYNNKSDENINSIF